MAQVIWQQQAVRQLQDIYNYYSDLSLSAAERLLDDLLNAPDILRDFPEIGTPEPVFAGIEPTFRYLLVRRNWKVIYFVLNATCHIAIIWDTRNNPDLLNDLIQTIEIE